MTDVITTKNNVSPWPTKNYEDFYSQLKSDHVLRLLLKNWYTQPYYQTYDTFDNSDDSTLFDLPPGVDRNDKKQSWFVLPQTDTKMSYIITSIKKRVIAYYNLEDDCQLEHSFLILVPGAQTMFHLDRGKFSGTFLMFPLLNFFELSILDDNKSCENYLIDSVFYVPNNVWHNMFNNSSSLSISLLINIPIDISKIKDAL